MAAPPLATVPLWLLLLGIGCVCILSLTVGPADVGSDSLLSESLAVFGWADSDPLKRVVLLNIRLPRLVLGLSVGAGLAVSGALLQAMFRNPLAEPTLVGVSSGAALGAAGAILLGSNLVIPDSLRAFSIPLCAALGGGIVTLFVMGISRRGKHTSTATLLLAGLAVTALVNACLGLAISFADDAQLRTLTFWLLGSLGGAQPLQVWISVPFMIVPTIYTLRLAGRLDLLLLGESEARHLGIDVERLKRRLIALAAITVGAAVAMSGVIGFVGLLVPHLFRLLLGPSHSELLPRVAFGGAGLLAGADIVARTAAAPAELPIGVLTALLGAPFFLWLLVRQDGRDLQ